MRSYNCTRTRINEESQPTKDEAEMDKKKVLRRSSWGPFQGPFVVSFLQHEGTLHPHNETLVKRATFE